MKRNTKRFLALGLAVLMAGSPVIHLQAEEGELVEITEQAEAMEISALNETAVEDETDLEEEQTVEDETAVQEETPEAETVLEENQEEETVQENSVEGDTTKDESVENEIVQGEIIQKEPIKNATVKEEAVEIKNVALKTAPASEMVETVELPENLALFALEIGDKTYEDGEYNIAIKSDFSMFGLIGSKAVLNGEKLTVTITTGKKHYDKIYLGNKEDEVKEPVYQGTLLPDGSGYSFAFDLTKEDLGKKLNFVPGKTDGSWYTKNQYTLTIPSTIEKIEPETPEEPELPTEPEKPTEEVENGDYQVTVDSSSSMFKVIDCVLTKRDGAMRAVITLSGTGYDYLYPGTAEEAAAASADTWIKYVENAEGKYTYMLPVSALDTPIAVAAHSIKNDKWYDRTLTFKAEGMEKIEPKLENGDYHVTVDSSAAMFKVVNCVLTSKDGAMSAVITLSGTGYDYLYLGTAEEAVVASEDTWVKYVENAEGKYTYTIPVAALDTPIAVAAHSIKNDKWYDRTLTFKAEGMEKIESETPVTDPEKPEDIQKPGTGGNVDSNTPDQESGHVTDLTGGTIRVNSTTTLKDGTYTPDQFSWSGGTGRVGISCNKITVKNGQAYATIVFSSGSYSYIKANGSIYYGTNTGSTSTFVIPVALNKNNTIIGMTTAMSTAHEIRYNIFIYLAAAAEGEQADVLNNQKLDEQAPVIAGLTYEEEIEMEYTEYVKLYRYENNILLLEIDMKTGTERELVEGETENLYEGNVVKYLIVPEDMEIPVGLEKNVVIIQKPVEKAYIADEEILSLLKEIGVEEEVLLEGEKEEPDYKEIVKNKCNLAILSSALLEEADEETLLEVSERFATLQIPLFVDRMEDEEEEEAKLEWLKVYGVIFDCEEKANEIYEEKLAEIKAE